tara:strand:+ start:696 stop:1736 length:1041 start_codon:yes stop_codon:yes gene_type:complete
MTPSGISPVGSLALVLLVVAVTWGIVVVPPAGSLALQVKGQPQPEVLDPASWGSDHVGKPVPEYMTGDECLFCHRKKVGPTWSANVHQTAMRIVEKKDAGWKALAANKGTSEMATMAEYVLGGDTHSRYLRRAKGYGKLDLLSVSWDAPTDAREGRLVDSQAPKWDGEHFGKACAGCHATGVDSKKQTFSAMSIDCFACHGSVELGHTKDTRLVHLSKRRADSPRVVASLCGQCHIRSGVSRSTGFPFANNFVAGDNLFRDLEVDLSSATISGMEPGGRHVMQNIREMVLHRETETTCLSCHDVHGQSTERHQELENQKLCFVCHFKDGPRSRVKSSRRHSSTCGY